MTRKEALWAGGTAAAFLASAAFVTFRTRQAEKHNPPLGQFAEIDGVRLHYVERGSGEPLVLLHGNGSMVQDFLSSGLVEMASRQYRVIIFDRPGYGWSERPRNRAWTPAAQAKLLSRALAAVGVTEKLHIVGHSWGTLVALEWALRLPEQVASLTLAGGYYYPTKRMDALLASGNAVPVLGDITRHTVTPIAGRLAWPIILKALFGPAATPQHFEQFPRAFALSPRALRAAAEEAAMMVPAAAKLQGRYPHLSVPVTIMAGEGDRIVSTEDQSVRLHNEIAGSTLQLFPGVGHMIHHTDPAGVFGGLAEKPGAGTVGPSA